jgi:cbb3-type cytochrome oxidase subunit 1
VREHRIAVAFSFGRTGAAAIPALVVSSVSKTQIIRTGITLLQLWGKRQKMNEYLTNQK